MYLYFRVDQPQKYHSLITFLPLNLVHFYKYKSDTKFYPDTLTIIDCGSWMADLRSDITKQKTLLTKMQTSLKNISAPQENIAKRVGILRKELTAAEKSIKDLRLDPAILEEIQAELKKAREELNLKENELKVKFGSDLAAALKLHNFMLEGHLPRLKTSSYTMDVDFPADTVTIWFGVDVEKLGTTKVIPEKVVEFLVQSHEAITGRPFDEKAFLRTLRTAYKMYLTRTMKPPGNDAPLNEIHTLCVLLIQNEKFRRNPVKDNLTEYTRAMFSYDLARLKTRSVDQNELKLSTAALIETQVKGNCFWVPPFEGTPAGTYSRMKFIGAS
jgi:hypothetical protein